MRKNFGFTLIEILITLVILFGIMSLSIFTIFAYVPKQRLLDSLETTEQMLSRAQLEATSRTIWSCVKYTPATFTLAVYIDNDSNHGAVAACGNAGDGMVVQIAIHDSIAFADCANGPAFSFDFTAGDVWFNSAGIPQTCNGGTCVSSSFQIVLLSTDLPPGNKAREVEAVSSGLIETVPRGEKGYIDTIFAQTTALTGSGACE